MDFWFPYSSFDSSSRHCSFSFQFRSNFWIKFPSPPMQNLRVYLVKCNSNAISAITCTRHARIALSADFKLTLTIRGLHSLLHSFRLGWSVGRTTTAFTTWALVRSAGIWFDSFSYSCVVIISIRIPFTMHHVHSHQKKGNGNTYSRCSVTICYLCSVLY